MCFSVFNFVQIINCTVIHNTCGFFIVVNLKKGTAKGNDVQRDGKPSGNDASYLSFPILYPVF